MTTVPDQTGAAAPWTLHAICELTRLAACGSCGAAGLDWPCTASSSGPEGYHVARFAAAMRRGLISGANFAAVIDAAGVFTNGTLIYDQPSGGTR